MSVYNNGLFGASLDVLTNQEAELTEATDEYETQVDRFNALATNWNSLSNNSGDQNTNASGLLFGVQNTLATILLAEANKPYLATFTGVVNSTDAVLETITIQFRYNSVILRSFVIYTGNVANDQTECQVNVSYFVQNAAVPAPFDVRISATTFSVGASPSFAVEGILSTIKLAP